MDKKLIEELKEKLEEQKIALQKELESFAKEDPKIKHNWDTKYPNREDGDKDEEADEVQEYDNKLSLEYSLELKLKDVTMALEKITAGTYGVCENCGKKIDEKRLLACPEAKTCLKCNEKK
ncbi:MAG: TraR/DksA C4-type zinc finger protein [Candidatus Staskawiczbacteria bacterium]|nr:TraR/DksA C4-type zinc finger protein [Candidatus Staskawiczbacteria bacterium]